MGALEAPTYAVAEANSRKLEKLDNTLATAADLSALSDAEQSRANALSTAVGNLASEHATAAASIRADIAEVRNALSAGGGGVDAVLARLDTLFCGPAIDTYLSTPGLTAGHIDGWLQDANARDAFARSVRAPYGLSYAALPAETWCALIASDAARALLDANDAGWWRIIINNGHVQQAVAASSTAMQAVAASSTAMQAVWASDVAAHEVMTHAVARNAIYESDAALLALQQNPVMVQKLTSHPAAQYANTSASSFEFVPNGVKVILLRRWYASSEYDRLQWGRGKTGNANTASPSDVDHTDFIVSPNRAYACHSGYAYAFTEGTYNIISGTYATKDDSSCNFVAAANGLKRHSYNNGRALHVRYIRVD